WVRIDKPYRFDTDEGSASLADLFRGRSQLLVYHFMFGPAFTAGCPACSSIAHGVDGVAVHLAHHAVMLWAISRAPLAKLSAYKKRMGWSFPWASSGGSDFNVDFGVASSDDELRKGEAQYNYAPRTFPPPTSDGEPAIAREAGTDWETFTRERPGMSAFAREDGVVYHTYSAYARGVDALWGMYPWLDRAPKGRND